MASWKPSPLPPAKEYASVEAPELKFDSAAGTFTGVASLFNTPDEYGDVVQPGAFAKSLTQRKPVMLLGHDPSQPVGLWTDLKETSRGLQVRGQLVDTALGQDVHKLLKSGALDGLSIGFRAKDAENTRTGRVLKEIQLLEISLVAIPAAPKARITSVRSFRQTRNLREFTRAVRAATEAIAKENF